MKKFLVRFSVFAFLLLSAIVLLNTVLWRLADSGSRYESFQNLEEKQLVDKYNSFLQLDSMQSFNTLFFGTSKIYRHLDPLLFDSLTNNSRTYNLAFGNLFPFRLYDAIEAVMEVKLRKDVSIFIEIAPIGKVGDNYDVVPIQKSIDFDRLTITNNYLQVFESKGNISATFLAACKALTWKYTAPSLMQKYLSLDNDKAATHRPLGIARNGFVPLDVETDQVILERHRPVKYPHPPITKPLLVDNKFFDYILETVTRLKQLGVKQVYFVVPPRIYRSDHLLIASIKEKLKQKGLVVFDLSDAKKYPEFYESDLSYDKTHLNLKGARRFTLELANAVRQHHEGQPLLVNN